MHHSSVPSSSTNWYTIHATHKPVKIYDVHTHQARNLSRSLSSMHFVGRRIVSTSTTASQDRKKASNYQTLTIVHVKKYKIAHFLVH